MARVIVAIVIVAIVIVIVIVIVGGDDVGHELPGSLPQKRQDGQKDEDAE